MDRSIATRPFLHDRRGEVAGTHRRHLKGHLTQAGEHGLGLEPVGVVAPGLGALVGTGPEELAALDLGSFADEDPQCFVGTVQAVLKQRRIGRASRGFVSTRIAMGLTLRFSMS